MTLLDTYYPFDTGQGATATVARWRSMARQFYASGVVPAYANQVHATLSGSLVTIQTGALWADGFYGEVVTPKTLAVPASATGQVVARMDPTARTIAFYFVANQKTPSQSLTGVYEIPLLQIAAGVATDARVFATPAPAQSVIKETMVNTSVATSWGSTAYATWWTIHFTKVRPDTLIDFYYGGSAWGTAGGWVEYGVQVTAPNASAVGTLTHFYFNVANQHCSIVGGLANIGHEMVAAGSTGTVTVAISVRNQTTSGPAWHIDGNDYHHIRVVEHMP